MPAQPLSVEYDYTVSRRGNIYKSFASLCDCIAADLRTKSAILDGEIVEFCPFTGATHHALTKQQRTLSNLTGAIVTNSETESATDSFCFYCFGSVLNTASDPAFVIVGMLITAFIFLPG